MIGFVQVIRGTLTIFSQNALFDPRFWPEKGVWDPDILFFMVQMNGKLCNLTETSLLTKNNDLSGGMCVCVLSTFNKKMLFYPPDWAKIGLWGPGIPMKKVIMGEHGCEIIEINLLNRK